MNKAFYHPNPSLQTPWNCTQLGLLVFPLSPFLGAVGIILASLLTWIQQYRTIIRRPLNWGFAILSVLLIITAGLADDKTSALLGLFNLIPFFLIFAGLSALIQTIAQIRQIAWILVISSVPVIIIGFGQFFLGWSVNFNFLWIVLQWILPAGGEPPGRMSSLLMHANTLAAYLVMVFILGLGLWLENYQQLRVKHQHSPHHPIPFLLVTVAIIANFIALILTNSRNGWAIAIFACLAYALYQGWRLLVGGVVAVITSCLLAAFAPSPIAGFFRQFVPFFFWARLNDDMYPDRPVALMRKTQWDFAWSLTVQHPWTGSGLRSFSSLYQAHTQLSLGHPHNFFLMLAAETGLPTTLLFFGLIGWILFAGIQLLRQSNYIQQADKLTFLSYLLVLLGWLLFNTVDVTLYDFRLNTLSWLLLSATCGVLYRYHRQDKLNANEES